MWSKVLCFHYLDRCWYSLFHVPFGGIVRVCCVGKCKIMVVWGKMKYVPLSPLVKSHFIKGVQMASISATIISLLVNQHNSSVRFSKNQMDIAGHLFEFDLHFCHIFTFETYSSVPFDCRSISLLYHIVFLHTTCDSKLEFCVGVSMHRARWNISMKHQISSLVRRPQGGLEE